MLASNRKISLSSGSDSCVLELWENPGACAVLFLSGSMSSPANYFVQIEALRKAGFAVSALHFSGHGVSPKTSKFTVHTLLSNIKQAELWLSRNEYPTFFLAGHSQGAMLALAHAAKGTLAKEVFAFAGILPRRKDNIELSIFSSLPFRDAAVSVLSILSGLIPWLPVPIFFYVSLKRVKSAKRQRIYIEGKNRTSYPLHYLSSLLNLEAKPEANCPVTLCYAPDDALFTPAFAQRTLERYQKAGNNNVSLHWMSGGGHTFPFNPEMATQAASLMAIRALSSGFVLKGSSWKVSR